MPNRIIRQSILDSDKVNALSWAAEVFYRRLMSIVDDYGRYDGRVSLIRAQLYPLKLDHVSDADVGKWLGECSEAGLVSIYEVEGKEYVEITNFGQTLRIKKSKFPAKNGICEQMQADENKCSNETNRNESKRIEKESGGGVETRAREEILNFFLKNFDEYWPEKKFQFEKQKEDAIAWKNDLKITYSGHEEKLKQLEQAFRGKLAKIEENKEKFVARQLEKFWNHFQAQGWKTSSGVEIVDRVAAFKKWIEREKEFAK